MTVAELEESNKRLRSCPDRCPKSQGFHLKIPRKTRILSAYKLKQKKRERSIANIGQAKSYTFYPLPHPFYLDFQDDGVNG